MSDWKTEPNIENRCTGAEQERKGRTHLCRLTKGHLGEHRCICSKRWRSR